jgi:hypothetical protein
VYRSSYPRSRHARINGSNAHLIQPTSNVETTPKRLFQKRKVRPKLSATGRKRLRGKKARPMKQPITPVVETTIVDVAEESFPAVAEFDETHTRETDAGREWRKVEPRRAGYL